MKWGVVKRRRHVTDLTYVLVCLLLHRRRRWRLASRSRSCAAAGPAGPPVPSVRTVGGTITINLSGVLISPLLPHRRAQWRVRCDRRWRRGRNCRSGRGERGVRASVAGFSAACACEYPRWCRLVSNREFVDDDVFEITAEEPMRCCGCCCGATKRVVRWL